MRMFWQSTPRRFIGLLALGVLCMVGGGLAQGQDRERIKFPEKPFNPCSDGLPKPTAPRELILRIRDCIFASSHQLVSTLDNVESLKRSLGAESASEVAEGRRLRVVDLEGFPKSIYSPLESIRGDIHIVVARNQSCKFQVGICTQLVLAVNFPKDGRYNAALFRELLGPPTEEVDVPYRKTAHPGLVFPIPRTDPDGNKDFLYRLVDADSKKFTATINLVYNGTAMKCVFLKEIVEE